MKRVNFPSFLIIFLLSCFETAKASSISVPLDTLKSRLSPASDLIQNSKILSQFEAYELLEKGVDISKINPAPSGLWQPVVKNLETFIPDIGQDLSFVSYDTSPREIFRFIVKDQHGQNWRAISHLKVIDNVIRHKMLRKLGYQLDDLHFFKSIKVHFKGPDEKKLFIDELSETTLTTEKRWIKEEGDLYLELRDITLEKVELKNANLYLPIMLSSRQTHLRVFRSLLVPYLLTNFPQSINQISWSIGRVFNEKLLLQHPFADAFINTTIEDLRWITRKILKLNFDQILKETQLPKDIQILLREKIKSRLLSLARLLWKNNTSAPLEIKNIEQDLDREVTIGRVKKGKLLRFDENENWASDLFNLDEKSPFRFREILRFFSNQTFYNALSSGLNLLQDELLPFDGQEENQEALIEKLRTHPRDTNIRSASVFTGNMQIIARRNIVFGQYLGQQAPLQLVDLIGTELSLGLLSQFNIQENISNGSTLSPMLNLQFRASRTYTHVRPMLTLKDATKASIKDVGVPLTMRKLGKAIQGYDKCTISKTPYLINQDLNDTRLEILRYNIEEENQLSIAQEMLREILIQEPNRNILLQAFKRSEECEAEKKSHITNELENFLRELGQGETFLINDQLSLGMDANLNIPLAPGGLSVRPSGGTKGVYLRSVLLRKQGDDIELSLQKQRNLELFSSLGINYFLSIAQMGIEQTFGLMDTEVYYLPLSTMSLDEKNNVLLTLRDFLTKHGSLRKLKSFFTPIRLEHRVSAFLKSQKALFLKSEKLKMQHKLKVKVWDKKNKNYVQKKFAQQISIKRQGSDFMSVIDQGLRVISPLLGLGQNTPDAGQGFLGRSKRSGLITEAEISNKSLLQPTHRFEIVYRGWKSRPRFLKKRIQKLHETYGHHLFNTQTIKNPYRFLSYDIQSTLILYPKALETIKRLLTTQNESAHIQLLVALYGWKNHELFCQRALDFFGDNGPQVYRGNQKTYNCLATSLQRLLKLVSQKKDFKTPYHELQYRHQLMEQMLDSFEIGTLLDFLPRDSYFLTGRIKAFRKNSEKGDINIDGHTKGEFDRIIQTGPLDFVAQNLKINSFELRALNYTPGMQ